MFLVLFPYLNARVRPRREVDPNTEDARRSPSMSTFVETLRHAFSMRRAGEPPFPPALERIARAAVERRLEIPAIVILETAVPVAFLGSQAMAAVAPLVKMLGFGDDLEEIAAAFEDRRTAGRLADRIEELAAAAALEGRR